MLNDLSISENVLVRKVTSASCTVVESSPVTATLTVVLDSGNETFDIRLSGHLVPLSTQLPTGLGRVDSGFLSLR